MPTLEDAIKLAKLSRSKAENPFARRKNAKFNIRNREEREGVLFAVHECYEGRFGEYGDPQPAAKKTPDKYLEQPGRISINVLKLFIDILAVSYDETPSRVYYRNGVRVDENPDTEDGKLVAALNKHLQAADYDRFMGMLDRWMRLFGNVVARPIWDEENKTLVFHGYPGYSVRVIENALNPRVPAATILLGFKQEVGDNGEPKEVETAEVWTAEEMVELLDGKETATHRYDDTSINYDFNPLVHCFDTPPFGGRGIYFVNAPGWSLAQQNQRINEDYISQYIYAVLMQAIGILVVKGQVGELTIGPGSAINFPNAEDQSGLESVGQNADLGAFQVAIEFIFDLIRETYGIPRSVFQAEVTSSGQAIIQANGPLAELRTARQPIFNSIENALLRSTLQELRGRAEDIPLTVAPAEWSVSLNYADIRANVSVTDEIAKDKHLIELGVLIAAEVLMREKPGQFDTIDEAQAWIDEQIKKQKAQEPDPVPGEEGGETPEDEAANDPDEVIETPLEEK